ncbi:MAG: GDSL-type esterase/lipase family protein [Bacteroidota bacterium]|nr:GDSL-type esterase/lipase family protein [Bacteroidota bacterium]
MKRCFKMMFILFVVFNHQQSLYSQQLPFWKEIQNFKQKDSVVFPASNAILFIGTSSFTMWKDIPEYFPGYPILNRAFGGSALLDQINYVNDIVYPYHPKQIFIYCGENDLSSSDTVTANDVYQRFLKLFSLIRKRNSRIPVYYVSMKPSPSRVHLLPKMIEGNNRIKKFLSIELNTGYIDVYYHMLEKDGKPMKNIFIEDQLHMNAYGYKI